MHIEYNQILLDEIGSIEKELHLSIKNKQDIFCFGAFYEKEPIGCISVNMVKDATCVINTFFVLPLFRQFGVGSCLLKNVEDYCINEQIKNIVVWCNSFDHNVDNVNKFLKKNGWESLFYKHTKYRIKREGFLENFVKKIFRENTPLKIVGYQILYLNQLSEIQIKSVNKKSYLVDRVELINKEDIIPELSLFILVENEFVAWCVVEDKQNYEICIHHTFVDEKYRTMGVGLYLWNIIFHQATLNNKFDKYKYISFFFFKTDERLLKLYNLLFGNYLYSNIDYFRASKILK